MVRVNRHAWYSYGASTTHKRDVRGSNAIQWQMMRDALAAGATVYDMRGITDTVESDDPHAGLLQFKVGTGGQAVDDRQQLEGPFEARQRPRVGLERRADVRGLVVDRKHDGHFGRDHPAARPNASNASVTIDARSSW